MRTIYAVVAVLALACGASGRVEPTLSSKVLRQAEECARDSGPCFMVHVSNDNFYRMAVTLNGLKIGEVEGNSSGSFAVPESRLKGGRCASVSLWLIGLAARVYSDSQCLGQGGYFTLQLDVLNHVWLTPWGGR